MYFVAASNINHGSYPLATDLRSTVRLGHHAYSARPKYFPDNGLPEMGSAAKASKNTVRASTIFNILVPYAYNTAPVA